MTAYYDRAGHEITFSEWTLIDAAVARSTVGKTIVSTSWLGIVGEPSDHPLLFETFVADGPNGDEYERYESEVQALAGHQRWLERVRAAVTE